MVYFNKFCIKYPFGHRLTTGMSNSFFDGQGFSEHQSRRLWPVSENAPYLLNPWYIWIKGALTWYGKLTCGSAHAWKFILCLIIVLGMILIFMVHLSFCAIPFLIYDVMYDITTIP